jgi:5-(carboxyamino)imidazole ribonucleotide mutase
LPGVVAAYTTRPVIGVPIDTGPLQGVDALLSMVQMPPGIPVATVAIGSVGARNAGYLAAQMLGMIDESLAAKIKQERLDNAQIIRDKNEGLSI